MTATPKRKRRGKATDRIRQQRLRDRRKADGWRRVSIWLSPEQVDTLESFGGEPWLGTTVKVFLEQAVEDHQRPPVKPGGLFALAGGDNANPTIRLDKAARLREADSLNASGLNWEAIARQWNAEGKRTPNGAEFRGNNIAREVRKWKQAGGTGDN